MFWSFIINIQSMTAWTLCFSTVSQNGIHFVDFINFAFAAYLFKLCICMKMKPVCLLADNCRCKIAFNQKSIRLQQIGSIKCISSNCIRWTIFSIIFNSLWTFWIQCPRPKMMSRLDTYIWRDLHTIFIERQTQKSQHKESQHRTNKTFRK